MRIGGRPGAFLPGWARFSPNASVYGADIDRDILFENDRINTFYCDRLDPTSIAQLWAHRELQEPFDILTDDGLHTLTANTTLMEHSIHMVRSGGLYIIEDLRNQDLDTWSYDIHSIYLHSHPDFIFRLVIVPSDVNATDNNLLVARRQ